MHCTRAGRLMLVRVGIRYKKELMWLLSRIHGRRSFTYRLGSWAISLFLQQVTILLYHSGYLSSFIWSQPSSVPVIIRKKSQNLAASLASTQYKYHKWALPLNSRFEITDPELPNQPSSLSNYSTNSIRSCMQLEVSGGRISRSQGGSTTVTCQKCSRTHSWCQA